MNAKGPSTMDKYLTQSSALRASARRPATAAVSLSAEGHCESRSGPPSSTRASQSTTTCLETTKCFTVPGEEKSISRQGLPLQRVSADVEHGGPEDRDTVQERGPTLILRIWTTIFEQFTSIRRICGGIRPLLGQQSEIDATHL